MATSERAALACRDADVFTYGFSNRTWEETLENLHSYKIELLADVRSLPGSKKYPQFNKEALEVELPQAGIEYRHLPELGGYRKAQRIGDINAAWRNSSFRNYADYMQTEQFDAGLEELIRLFKEKRTVYVCTEAVFWRCHRALISDALLIRGYKPGHIFTASHCELHRLTSFASVDGSQVTYPA